MEKEQRTQRIAEAQEHIFSGALARTGSGETEVEPVEDISYRVKCDEERSRAALADLLGGKIFGRREEQV